MCRVVEIFIVVVLFSSYRCWVITRSKHLVLYSVFTEDMDIIDEEMARQRFNWIYPGTKWCGTGNIADSYDDLGSARDTDMCCRDHDYCPDFILAGETKYNLTNPSAYTRLSCACDEIFRLCLRDAQSRIADRVGSIYFNALGTKCYKKDYPVIGCNAYGGWFGSKCLSYLYDNTTEKQYQWFDVKNY